MQFLVLILAFLVIILVIYIIFIELQLHHINEQLQKRLKENTREQVSLELFNSGLNNLAININKCLKAEENLRLNGIREEKKFKELIANISHDLRTPLTAIKGYQQLMEKGELNDSQNARLSVAQKHTEELGNLIEHFFEYSYLMNSEITVNAERLNLTNVVIDCLAAFVTAFEENNMTVCFEKTPPIYVVADKEMVTRIVQNLIRNCIQHASGNVEVSIKACDKAVISFKNAVDSDFDIEPQRIFERFYTKDKARTSSTGLGLSIVKLLAEKMDGEAFAEVKNGMLSIEVELPLYNEN